MIALAYLALKSFALQPMAGDEYVYIYEGKRVAEGSVPYRDLTMGHPPLQVLFTAVIFKLANFSVAGFRLIPICWALLGALLLALCVKRELGAFTSCMAMVIYLFSYEPLRASSHFTGINMTLALLMAAFLAQRTERILLCAVLCTLAIFTRLYALPIVLIFVISAFWRNISDGKRLLLWTLGLCFFVFGLTALCTDARAFIQDVFLNQAEKTSMDPQLAQKNRDEFLFHNAAPIGLFLLGLITVKLRFYHYFKESKAAFRIPVLKNLITSGNFSLVVTAICSAVFIALILFNLERVWLYYYVLLFPFIAITGAWMLNYWLETVLNLIRGEKNKSIKVLWPVLSALLFLLVLSDSSELEKRLDYYQAEMKRSPEQRTHSYTWKDGRVPVFMNTLVKQLFWKDQRIIGKSYNSITYYLWHTSRGLENMDAICAEIRTQTNPQEYIFGDSGTVPLFALLTDRQIAGDEVDTNVERFKQDANAEKLLQHIDQPGTKLIILRSNMGIARLEPLQNLVRQKYKQRLVLNSTDGSRMGVFERKAGL